MNLSCANVKKKNGNKTTHSMFWEILMSDILIGQIDLINHKARGGSNEYPQSMFWSKNKYNRYTPAYPILLYKSGV